MSGNRKYRSRPRRATLALAAAGTGILATGFLGGHLARSLAAEGDRPLHHIVLLDLQDGLPAADRAALVTAGETLLAEIPGVRDVQIGDRARSDRPVHIKNYDLALYVEFDREAALDGYGPHPNHQAFVELASPLLEPDGIRVLDFYGRGGGPIAGD